MTTLRNQAIKLGLFVIIVTVILLLALFVIGGLNFLKPVHRYVVITDEAVSGIDVNSAVTMRGVAIGKVKAIELDRSDFAHVTIELAIDPDIEIPVGSKAYFERIGLTGERAIDISGGSLSAGELAPGSKLPRGETDLEDLQARATELGDELTTLIADLTETVEHIETLVEAIDPERLESIAMHTERATRHLASAGAQLERGVVEGRVDLAKITARVDEVATAAATALEHADAGATALLRTIEHADAILHANQTDLRLTLDSLRRASQDAKLLVEELREQPSLLLRSKGRQKKHEKRKRR